MAITNFKNDATADIFNGINSKKARNLVAQKATKAAKKKLDALVAAATIEDLKKAGHRITDLKHTMPGFYHIEIDGQFRILFRLEGGQFVDVEIADYHGGKKE